MDVLVIVATLLALMGLAKFSAQGFGLARMGGLRLFEFHFEPLNPLRLLVNLRIKGCLVAAATGNHHS